MDLPLFHNKKYICKHTYIIFFGNSLRQHDWEGPPRQGSGGSHAGMGGGRTPTPRGLETEPDPLLAQPHTALTAACRTDWPSSPTRHCRRATPRGTRRRRSWGRRCGASPSRWWGPMCGGTTRRAPRWAARQGGPRTSAGPLDPRLMHRRTYVVASGCFTLKECHTTFFFLLLWGRAASTAASCYSLCRHQMFIQVHAFYLHASKRVLPHWM